MNNVRFALFNIAIAMMTACQSISIPTVDVALDTNDEDLRLIVSVLNYNPDDLTVCSHFLNTSNKSFYVPKGGARFNKAYSIAFYGERGEVIGPVQTNLSHNTLPAYRPNANTHAKLEPGNIAGGCFSISEDPTRQVKRIVMSVYVLKLSEEDFEQVKNGTFNWDERPYVQLRGVYER